jgi:hypothetical protein
MNGDNAARELDATDLDLIEKERSGARARTKRIVREGLPALPANAEINERKKEIAQYRAGVSLLWDRERILQETGWSLQRFLAVERAVREEDRRLAEEIDPRVVFSEYRLQQLQAAQELEDLAEVFRHSRQFSALVSAVKTRSDILDRVVKTGQELGVIKRAAREVNVNAQVDFRSMSVRELRVHLRREMAEVRDLLGAEPEPSGLAQTVLSRVLSGGEPAAAPDPPRSGRRRRVKRLASRPQAPAGAAEPTPGPTGTP